MTHPELATVIVSEEAEGPASIRFEFCTGESIPLLLPDRRPLDSASRSGRAYLEALRRKVPGLRPSDPELLDGLTILFSGGVQLGVLLAGQDVERLQSLSAAFRRARNRLPAEAIPLVQLIARDATFPLELLPLFDLTDLPAEIESLQQLEEVAQRFVGFSAIVRRLAPATDPLEEVIDNAEGLSVQLIRWREKPGLFKRHLSGFDIEQRFLGSLAPAVSVDGPWPMSDLTQAEVRSRLLDALYDPATRLEASEQADALAHIQHFVCHCTTNVGRDDDYELRLSTENGAEHRIRLADIRQGYVSRIARDQGQAPRERRAPLIMNACGSSSVDPVSALSLPTFFLQNRHPAFVGTQAAMPDIAGAAYAEHLYRFLLAGCDLGEALVRARRRLLAGSRSPLGLFYVLYGNEQIKLASSDAEFVSDPDCW